MSENFIYDLCSRLKVDKLKAISNFSLRSSVFNLTPINGISKFTQLFLHRRLI